MGWATYRGSGRLVWRIRSSDGAAVQNQQAATAEYEFYPMGILTIAKAGKVDLDVSLVEGDGKTASLESLRLTRVE